MELTTREKFIILIDNERIKKSDAIILLEGDGFARLDKVCELFFQNWANKVVVSGGILDPSYGSFPYDILIPKLLTLGIPENDIIIDGNSKNTKEQSVEVIKIAKENNWKRIILVASNYHKYRAYLTFLKEVLTEYPTLELINSAVRDLLWFEETGWGKRFDLLLEEFKKIETYKLKGHIATYEQALEYQKWKEQQV
jgi:uncharacterized SAM-binding protein YcdF (DUF218 family)